jgi:hypothetical protein
VAMTGYCAFAPKWRVVLKSIRTPLFLEDENSFQKSASMVLWGIEFPIEPLRPIFEKSSHLREKGVHDQVNSNLLAVRSGFRRHLSSKFELYKYN